jgi:hypothetical protein
MAITSTTTAFGPGVAAASTPNVPGVPAFYSNDYLRITSANDGLVLTSNKGGPVTIDIPDAYYTMAGMATALATALNGSTALTGTTGAGHITFTATFNTSTLLYTVDATTGHTIAYTHTGSDAGATFGFAASHAAAQTLVSDDQVGGFNTILFTFTAGTDNDSTVVYSLYDNTRSAYIKADGTTGTTSVWQTFTNWNGGGASGRVATYGTTTYTAYTFKAAAKNVLGTTTAFSASSTNMYSNVLVDWGTASDELDREVTSGNTKIKLSGVTVAGASYTVYGTSGYGAIPLQLVLQNNSSTLSRVALEFSEDQENYTTAADFYIVTSANDGLRFTSDKGGPVTVDVPDATYNSGTSMAAALATALNGSTALTGSTGAGHITFAVTYSTTTFKYTINATTGHTIALDYWNSDGAYSFGFNDSTTAAQTNVSDESRGVCPRSMPTSPTGVESTIYWDSYSDAGKSEHDSTVTLRFTPYDVSPSGGDAGAVAVSNTFEVDNTPAQVTLTNADGFTWDEDTTPAFVATMGSVRGGSVLFFELTVTDYSDALIFTKDSSLAVAGWEYQPVGSSYVACLISGVPAQYANNINKIRYTVQAADALTAANAQPYKVTLKQGEIRDVG